MRWCVYYGDGSTYSDRDGPPFDAPTSDVQVIAQEADTPQGFILMHGATPGQGHYCWKDDLGWLCCDWAGLWDYLLMHRGPKAVLLGRTIRNGDFFNLLERAGKEGVGQ